MAKLKSGSSWTKLQPAVELLANTEVANSNTTVEVFDGNKASPLPQLEINASNYIELNKKPCFYII